MKRPGAAGAVIAIIVGGLFVWIGWNALGRLWQWFLKLLTLAYGAKKVESLFPAASGGGGSETPPGETPSEPAPPPPGSPEAPPEPPPLEPVVPIE